MDEAAAGAAQPDITSPVRGRIHGESTCQLQWSSLATQKHAEVRPDNGRPGDVPAACLDMHPFPDSMMLDDSEVLANAVEEDQRPWKVEEPPFWPGQQHPVEACMRRDQATTWALNDLVTSSEFLAWLRATRRRSMIMTWAAIASSMLLVLALGMALGWVVGSTGSASCSAVYMAQQCSCAQHGITQQPDPETPWLADIPPTGQVEAVGSQEYMEPSPQTSCQTSFSTRDMWGVSNPDKTVFDIETLAHPLLLNTSNSHSATRGRQQVTAMCTANTTTGIIMPVGPYLALTAAALTARLLPPAPALMRGPSHSPDLPPSANTCDCLEPIFHWNSALSFVDEPPAAADGKLLTAGPKAGLNQTTSPALAIGMAAAVSGSIAALSAPDIGAIATNQSQSNGEPTPFHREASKGLSRAPLANLPALRILPIMGGLLIAAAAVAHLHLGSTHALKVCIYTSGRQPLGSMLCSLALKACSLGTIQEDSPTPVLFVERGPRGMAIALWLPYFKA